MSWVDQTSRVSVRPDDEPTYRSHRYSRSESTIAAVTGVVTAAMVLLALLVLAGKLFGQVRNVPGPSGIEVGLHAAGAVAALGLQLLVRRARAGLRILAALGIVVVTAALLWVFWWA
ncbi:MAG: hypothetical protein ACRDQ5_09855 [Sciscionella sp.]